MIVFEDLPPGERFALGPTSATREEVMAFAQAFDPQAFHLSDEAASRTYFGRLSASGWHTAAMMLALVTDNPDWPLACRGCHEIRNLNWRAPVYPGDCLVLTVVIAGRGSPEAGRAGRVTMDLAFTNQDDKTVAEMTLVLAVARRGG